MSNAQKRIIDFVKPKGYVCVSCKKNDILRVVVSEYSTSMKLRLYCQRCGFFTDLYNPKTGLVRTDFETVLSEDEKENEKLKKANKLKRELLKKWRKINS